MQTRQCQGCGRPLEPERISFCGRMCSVTFKEVFGRNADSFDDSDYELDLEEEGQELTEFVPTTDELESADESLATAELLKQEPIYHEEPVILGSEGKPDEPAEVPAGSTPDFTTAPSEHERREGCWIQLQKIQERVREGGDVGMYDGFSRTWELLLGKVGAAVNWKSDATMEARVRMTVARATCRVSGSPSEGYSLGVMAEVRSLVEAGFSQTRTAKLMAVADGYVGQLVGISEKDLVCSGAIPPVQLLTMTLQCQRLPAIVNLYPQQVTS